MGGQPPPLPHHVWPHHYLTTTPLHLINPAPILVCKRMKRNLKVKDKRMMIKKVIYDRLPPPTSSIDDPFVEWLKITPSLFCEFKRVIISFLAFLGWGWEEVKYKLYALFGWSTILGWKLGSLAWNLCCSLLESLAWRWPFLPPPLSMTCCPSCTNSVAKHAKLLSL